MKHIPSTILLALLLALSASGQFGAKPARAIETYTATIASGASLSGSVALNGCTPLRLLVPTITAANFTYQLSPDGTNWYNLYDSFGSEATTVVPGTGGVMIQLDPASWVGVRFLKIRSGTSGTPVNQGADRTVTISCKVF